MGPGGVLLSRRSDASIPGIVKEDVTSSGYTDPDEGGVFVVGAGDGT